MDYLNSLIGNNLRRIRKEMGLSLDKVSEITGVSKGMLGQIERGESSPTVNTLWKIANGLRVSFSTLMGQEGRPVSIIHHKEVNPIMGQEGKYRAYPIFPYDQRKKFEIFTVELEPGCSHNSDAHNRGVEEYVIVSQGKLELLYGDKVYEVNEGDGVSFVANKSHTYRNKTTSITKIQVLNYYSY